MRFDNDLVLIAGAMPRPLAEGQVIGVIGTMVVVMAVVAIFVFLLLYLTPGDPAVVIAG